MTFGERVLALRTEKGMTQDELAHAVGYKSRSTIAKIESGERDPHQSMIAAIAKALDTTPAYLMGWEDKKPTVEELYGKMIKRLREQQNLSVDELSKICHIDSNYLIGVEENRELINNQTLETILSALSTNLNDQIFDAIMLDEIEYTKYYHKRIEKEEIIEIIGKLKLFNHKGLKKISGYISDLLLINEYIHQTDDV